MTAIYKREMRSYLTSPTGYVFLAVFYAIAGYYFFATSLVSNTTDMSYVFSNLFSIVIFIVPILTMKSLSDERRQRTEQALFTAPVSFTSIVMGKFFASLTVFLLGMTVTVVYFLVMCFFSTPAFSLFAGNFFGLMLLGLFAVRDRNIHLGSYRKPDDSGYRLTGCGYADDVFQQLYSGCLKQAADSGGDGHLLLPALSGLYKGTDKS